MGEKGLSERIDNRKEDTAYQSISQFSHSVVSDSLRSQPVVGLP